jgi:signal transduction histidine kinase
MYKRFHIHVEGKGLGLHLVKTQVEALHGRIEVESMLGEGTSFKIYLPNRKGSKRCLIWANTPLSQK